VSCTLKVGEVDPMVVGLPLIAPAALNINPEGRGADPGARLHE
jgi:hypothetical protein